MTLKKLFPTLFAFALLNGCSAIDIKDAEWCGDVGNSGAACYHTLSDEEREISKAQWDQERFGMLCTKPENFANWKEAILKLCKESNRCSFEDQALIEKNSENLEEFKQKLVTP